MDVDAPIAYLQRTRDWYAALGYDTPYVWAEHAEVPFTRLRVPVSAARVTLVTTAAPYRPDKGPQGPGAPYNAAAKFHEVWSGDTGSDPDLRIAHVAIDRRHASMADSHCWFPLPALRQARADGRVGSLAARFHGLPTDRSQRRTIEVLAPEILARCRADQVDAVILVGNCPVCHQSVSLVARHLEANGLATVVIGGARDVVERCGVPRFLFNDFPLGNVAARPGDAASRHEVMALALRLLDEASGPRTTVRSPLRWSDDPAWKRDYMNAAALEPGTLTRLREEHEAARRVAAADRAAPSTARDPGILAR